MLSFYEDEEVLQVLAELDGVNPVLDGVTGKREDTSIVEATNRPSGERVRSRRIARGWRSRPSRMVASRR